MAEIKIQFTVLGVSEKIVTLTKKGREIKFQKMTEIRIEFIAFEIAEINSYTPEAV